MVTIPTVNVLKRGSITRLYLVGTRPSFRHRHDVYRRYRFACINIDAYLCGVFESINGRMGTVLA